MLVALFASCATVLAATPAEIEARVTQSAREQLLKRAADAGLLRPKIEITSLPRATLSDCPRDVEVETLEATHPARMRFVAVCSVAPAWRAEFIVRAVITAEVVVTSADLKAGVPIDASQLTVQRRDISGAFDAQSDPGTVAGKSSRHALRSGQIVRERWLVEPDLVKRGASVSIVAHNVGVEVNVAGEALDTGHRGEIVGVRNKATGKVIRARVIGENSVEPVELSMPSATQ